MSKKAIRVFSREFKFKIVRRMRAGENVSALAREVKVLRKDLYVWRDRFRAAHAAPCRAVAAARTMQLRVERARELLVYPDRPGDRRRGAGRLLIDVAFRHLVQAHRRRAPPRCAAALPTGGASRPPGSVAIAPDRPVYFASPVALEHFSDEADSGSS